NLFQELDAVIHLLMEAKHWGLRKSRNATSLNSRFKSLDTLKVKIISVTFRRVIRTNHKKASKIDRKSVVYGNKVDKSEQRKNKTAYEIGLGIPAEPLFRSRISSKSLMRLSICLWKPSIGD